MRADRFHCLERGWKGTHYSIKRPRVNGALSNVSEAKFSVSSSVFSFLSLSLFPPGLIYLLAILSAVLFDSFWQSKAKLSGQLPDPRWFDDSVRAEFERVSIISDLEQGQKGLAAFDLPLRSSYPRENRPFRSVARLDPPPSLRRIVIVSVLQRAKRGLVVTSFRKEYRESCFFWIIKNSFRPLSRFTHDTIQEVVLDRFRSRRCEGIGGECLW